MGKEKGNQNTVVLRQCCKPLLAGSRRTKSLIGHESSNTYTDHAQSIHENSASRSFQFTEHNVSSS